MLCNVLDCALYPLLLTDYLQRFVLPILLPTYQSGIGGDSDWQWLKHSHDLLGPSPLSCPWHASSYG